MTDKDFEELESIPAEERARLLGHKETFSLGNDHMAMIVELLADDDAKLGRIMRDLVQFMTTGENVLLDNIDESDRIGKHVRLLLYDDCKHFNDRWLLTSYRSSKHRKKPETDESSDDGSVEQDHTASVDGYPSSEEVITFALERWQGSMSIDEVKRIAGRWYDSMTKNHWQDDRHEKVRDWRSLLNTYVDKAWRKR